MSDTTSNEAGPESLQSLSDDDLRNLRRAMRDEMKRRGLGAEKKAGRAAGGKAGKVKAKAAARRGAKRAKRAGAAGGGEAA